MIKLSVPQAINLYKNGEILADEYFMQLSPIFENSKLEYYVVFKRKEPNQIVDVIKIKVA